MATHPSPDDIATRDRNEPGLRATVDQMEAATSFALRLAPHNRQFLKVDSLRAAMTLALGRLPDEVELGKFGAVPVVRWLGRTGGDSTVYERRGSAPIKSARTIEWCSACHDNISSSVLVPFWVARGDLIVQLDMCPTCADHWILEGAIPQVGADDA